MRSQEFVTLLSGGSPDAKTQARSSLLRDAFVHARLPYCNRHPSIPMSFRKFRFASATAAAVAIIASMAACGDPKGQAVPITVSFSSTYPLPTALTTGSTVGIEAVVDNDNQDAGVTFSCTPDTPAGECGTFTPPGAGTNVPSCYQAPDAVPGGDGTVTLTATSVTDPTKSVSSQPITISSGEAVITCTP